MQTQELAQSAPAMPKLLPSASASVIKEIAEEADYVNCSHTIELETEPMYGEVSDIYELPKRDWEGIISRHNNMVNAADQFPLRSYQVKSVLYNCSIGHIPRVVMQAMGIPRQRFIFWREKADKLQAVYEQLMEREFGLTEDEKTQLLFAGQHPLRMLFNDIKQVEAMAHLKDIDDLNTKAKDDGHLQLKKMRQRWREDWGAEAENNGATVVNVQVMQLGNVDLDKL